MRESVLQLKVVEYARALGIIARKLDFGQGWPDYMFLYRGQIYFIEFKAHGQLPSPLQQLIQSKLVEAGFNVDIVDDADLGKNLIRNFYDRAQVARVREPHDTNK